MTTPHGYRRVDLPIDRSDEVMDVDGWGFSFTPRRKEARALLDVFEYSRGRGIEIADAAHGEVGSLAAVHTSFAHDLRLPGGGSILTSGLTWVAVHPGHRRRGLLTSMLHDHFSRSLERGEVISTLTASEPPIYQRFGYGMASMTCRLQLPRGAALRPVPGADDLTIRLENADVAKHADAVRQVQSRMDRPGTMVTLADPILKDLFIDVPALRGGAERLRIAIVEDADGPAAYALFFRKTDWDNGHPNGATTIK